MSTISDNLDRSSISSVEEQQIEDIDFLWLASVISALFFNKYLLGLNISDQVLIVLLTTTSINVIGMMLIILKNLFPQNNE